MLQRQEPERYLDTVGLSGSHPLAPTIFFDREGSVSGVAAFQPREQLRYNGVRKVRAVRAVRTEEMPLLLRKTAECCKT